MDYMSIAAMSVGLHQQQLDMQVGTIFTSNKN